MKIILRTLTCVNPECRNRDCSTLTPTEVHNDGTIIAFCRGCGAEYKRQIRVQGSVKPVRNYLDVNDRFARKEA